MKTSSTTGTEQHKQDVEKHLARIQGLSHTRGARHLQCEHVRVLLTVRRGLLSSLSAAVLGAVAVAVVVLVVVVVAAATATLVGLDRRCFSIPGGGPLAMSWG